MATATVPTVPFPTDIDDTDDDDDDGVASPIPQPVASTPPAQPPPAATLVPAPAPPPAVTSVPGAPSPVVSPSGAPTNSNGIAASGTATASGIATASGSGRPFADSLPSSLSSPNPSPNDNGGLGTGAKAGLGVGVAIGVILMALAALLYVRTRRRKRQQRRKTSRDSNPDVETAHQVPGPAVRAYRAPGAELPDGTGAVKYRHHNELASPVVAQEVHGDREFAIELPGSAVPSNAAGKEAETWSPNPPTYNQSSAGPPTEKGGERLFDDAPIDADEDTFDVYDQPRTTDRKSGL